MSSIPGAFILHKIWKRYHYGQKEASKNEAKLAISALAGQLRHPSTHKFGYISQTFNFRNEHLRDGNYNSMLFDFLEKTFTEKGYFITISVSEHAYTVTLDWRKYKRINK